MIKKKNKIIDKNIHTSLEGFKYVGINLTEQQYDDLLLLNMLILGSEKRQKIPVFNTMLVLKTLGLLPAEMINDDCANDCNQNPDCDLNCMIQKKFGKYKEKPYE